MKQFTKLKDSIRRYAVIMILLAAFLTVMPADVSAATTPKLNQKTATLNISDTLKLKVSNTTSKVTYSSSKKSVAAVSTKGVVTAKALGTATIYAKVSKGATLKCKVTVAAPTYKISPKSKLYNGKANTNGSYALLRSYMKRLESTKGGTLVLKAGTYTFTKSVFIPSNVTIQCNKGVKLVKDNTSDESAVTMFNFVAPSIGTSATKKKPIAVKEYNASCNVKVLGNETYVDMKEGGIAFQFAHNNGITVSGFDFTNMDEDGHHFVDINSSKDITISDCTMDAAVTDVDSYNSCINIGMDDKNAFNGVWSSDDGTACDGITITDCYFANSGTAIGSNYYGITKTGEQIYQEDITIDDCIFDSVGTTESNSSAAIRMISWQDSSITNNRFVECTGGKGCPVRADGSDSITFTGNTFKQCATNTISSTYKDTKYECTNNFIFWSKSYNVAHPTCAIYNTYLLKKATKNIVTADEENYYEYYCNYVEDNKVSSDPVEFTLK